MAGRKFSVNASASTAASTTKTILAVKAPAAAGIVLTAMEVSFQGANAATDGGVTVEYYTCTTDGTGTAATINNADRQDDNSAGTTGQYNYTVEPSGSVVVIRSVYVDANKGNDSFPGSIRLKQGEVFGIRTVGPGTLTTVTTKAFIGGDE